MTYTSNAANLPRMNTLLLFARCVDAVLTFVLRALALAAFALVLVMVLALVWG